MPMSANNVVQTGPNTHTGGLSGGLTRLSYQPSMDGIVNIEPMIPASSDITMERMSLNVLWIFMRRG